MSAAEERYTPPVSSLARSQAVTIAEALRRPEHERLELIRGTLVPKAAPTAEHGRAQSRIVTDIGSQFDRRPGGRFPAGWWILTETDVQLGDELMRPDIAGWRRDNVPVVPSGRPVKTRPDWVCEVLSPSTESIDRVDKLQSYFQARVPHYWLADPLERVLEVYRRTDVGFTLVLTAKAGQTVRAEPFEAIELDPND